MEEGTRNNLSQAHKPTTHKFSKTVCHFFFLYTYLCCMNDYNEHVLLLNKRFKNKKHNNKLTIH